MIPRIVRIDGVKTPAKVPSVPRRAVGCDVIDTILPHPRTQGSPPRIRRRQPAERKTPRTQGSPPRMRRRQPAEWKEFTQADPYTERTPGRAASTTRHSFQSP